MSPWRKLASSGTAWLWFLVLWQVVSLFGASSLPGPWVTVPAALELAGSASSLGAGLVLAGWSLGSLVAVPLGALTARTPAARALTAPFLAFIALFLLWFGAGTLSEAALVFYASLFTVALGTRAGVGSIPEDRLRAAGTLGASKWQLVRRVIVPAALPSVFTGVRQALGLSFAAVIGVGMLAPARVFAGLAALGLLGLLVDRLLFWGGRTLLRRYGVFSGG